MIVNERAEKVLKVLQENLETAASKIESFEFDELGLDIGPDHFLNHITIKISLGWDNREKNNE